MPDTFFFVLLPPLSLCTKLQMPACLLHRERSGLVRPASSSSEVFPNLYRLPQLNLCFFYSPKITPNRHLRGYRRRLPSLSPTTTTRNETPVSLSLKQNT